MLTPCKNDKHEKNPENRLVICQSSSYSVSTKNVKIQGQGHDVVTKMPIFSLFRLVIASKSSLTSIAPHKIEYFYSAVIRELFFRKPTKSESNCLLGVLKTAEQYL